MGLNICRYLCDCAWYRERGCKRFDHGISHRNYYLHYYGNRPGGTATDSAAVVVVAVPEDVDFGLDFNEQQGGGGLVGETIRILNGNSLELRSDLNFPSPNSLGLSFLAVYSGRFAVKGSLGFGWTHTYEASLDPGFQISGMSFIRIVDHTGRGIYFTEKTHGVYAGAFKERTHVEAEAESYIWYRLDGTRYVFSASGKLNFIEDEKGNRQEAAYDTQGRLESVTDTASGRTLTFTYNTESLLESITGPVTAAVPSGVWVTYGYDANQNLTSVTYADGSGLTYDYSDPNDAHNLTEKKNKAGHLVNTWAYDSQDRCINNFSAGGRGVAVSYESDNQINVTDAYGTLRTYTLEDISGRKRVTAMQGPVGAPYNNSSTVRWAYDTEMNLVETQQADGTVNLYSGYDTRGNPGTVILASGTQDQRTITLTYHPDINVLLTRTEAGVLGAGNKEIVFDYDSDYDTIPNQSPTKLLSRVIDKGYTKDASESIVSYEYVTTFTYNNKGQIVTVDGPLTGADDTTTLAYNATTGDLASFTKPLIGTTTFSAYDAAGQPGSMTNVNSQTTTLSHDARGRIAAVTNPDSSAKTFTYNTAGDLASKADEDSINHNYTYDTDYGRLVRTTDAESNYVAYSYDTQGNLIERGYYDSSDTRTYRKQWSYQHPDIPGRLYREINPDGTFTEYSYDTNGNLASVTDPKGNTTTYTYDSLNRVVSMTQPGGIITTYTYDIHGNLASETDANANVTAYQYDDMGRIVSTTSPDTGTVTYFYDQAGNPLSKTDAMGITVDYTYDILNRLTAVRFPDPSQDITFTYDAGEFGMGRCSGMTDPSGSTSFGYDSRGRLIEKTSTISGHAYSTARTYTPGSRISSITYPTGRTVDNARNSTGKIFGVATTDNGTTTTLIGNISYRPFGPASALDIGTGSGVSNVFDELYRTIVSNPGADTERTYTYDANGNLTSINVTNDSSKSRTFAYDALNRLEHAEGPYGTIDYTYDNVGNRLTRTVNDQTETYTYFTGTNRLQEVTGPVAYAYDANGNSTQMGGKTFVCNQNSRLVRVKDNSDILGEYTYNGLGQRVIKEADGVTTIFHYDFDGNLIAESLPDGTITSEYLYMGTSRLARVDVGSSAIYYYLNDHLGTPQIMTDASGTAVWEATSKPFGEADVNSESVVNNNFRLPGQVFDKESGLHYNYFRDYHPGIGRYVEADPIGLKGGINLYVYANNNPVNLVDPRGDFGIPGAVIGGFTGAFGGFLGGIQSGKVWAGIAGGAVGGLSGALLGSALGPVKGGAIGGAFGGFVGGVLSKHLGEPDASDRAKLLTGAKGAGIGLITGTISGKLSSALKTVVGASGPAVEIAKDMITAPIALGLGLINLGSESDTKDETGQEGINGPTITQEYTPLPAPPFEYAPNNPEEIDRNSSVTISVIGGTPPYSWSVSGTGFHFESVTGPTTITIGLKVVQLWADDIACGSATITITDSAGQTATGYVRCSTGQWTYMGYCQSALIGDTYGCDVHSGPFLIEYIGGDERWATRHVNMRCATNDSGPATGVWVNCPLGVIPPPFSPIRSDICNCACGPCYLGVIGYYKWECP